METQTNQININLSKSKIKPIFADEIGIALRVKATNNDKGQVEKEGHIAIIFIDMIKQQPVGEFVISRTTAKALVNNLGQSLASLDKELANKNIPKQPEIKTTWDQSSIR